MWQINNAKAAESIITSVLKKLSYLSGKAVIAIMKQLLLQVEAYEVSWGDFKLLERTFNIYIMDLAENGKISFKGILLF